jgi:outer membrane protein OmpA-like peptidoglycan-associated protein
VRIRFGASLTLVVALGGSLPSAQSPEVPIVPGVNFVLAVANATSGDKAPVGILQGDYEMVVTIANVTPDGITHLASFDGTDAAGVQRSGTVSRVVPAADLASAPVQILGFHQQDPPRVNGTTALGPSLNVTRDLAQKGTAAYSFRLWAGQDAVSGTLRRSSSSPVKFPVLLNGRRVELEAIHATGEMALGSAKRPFETVILNHPRYPISLRIAYGPRDGGFPFKPDFVREVVRIDLPSAISSSGAGGARAGAGGGRVGAGGGDGGGAGNGGGNGGGRMIADALNKECRVELSGIYFDFNQATLKPLSDAALKEIAGALRTSQRRLAVEGHTDNIGSDQYNNDLSMRRAAAVKTALVRDHGVDGTALTTAGYGERRPIETNETLAGRARNRRVELVCAKGP